MAHTNTRPPGRLEDRVDRELLGFLETERAHIEPEAHPLLDELAAIISAGGKRLRPRFCYWGHVAGGGGDSAEIVRVGAALELLHTFAMIHDDVMDAAPLRRSRHSTFRALAELANEVPHRGDPKRFGTSAALLTGLLGFVLADGLLQTCGFPSDVMPAVNERFDRMRTAAIAGQYLDLLAAYRGTSDEDTALRIAALKSGRYSVVDPLVIGARCARADDEVTDALEAYGAPLGQAFQIADDVLGVFGDPARTGKDRDGDLREGKQTVLLAKARALADPGERALLDRVGDAALGPQDADAVRNVIVGCGALDATRELIGRLAAEAVSAIDASAIDKRAKEALRALANEVTDRDA